MKIRAIAIGLCLSIVPWLPAGADEAFQAQLRHADAVRSSDPAAFVRAIDILDARRDEASLEQKQHLQLLHAYKEGFQGNFDAAVKLAEDLHGKAVDPEVKQRASLLIANSAAATRDFALGLTHLERALAATGVPDADPKLREQALAVATILYSQFDKFELSRQYADQLIAATDNPRTLCIARQQRLTALRGLGAWPSDSREVEDALAECEAVGEKVFASFIRIEMAKHLAEIGDNGAAERLLSRHLKEAEAAGYTRLISEFHSLLAGFRLERGDLVNARKLARSAIDIDSGNSASVPKVEAMKVLYEVARRNGDIHRALDYYRQYADADKAYLDDVMVRELAFRQSRAEAQQKDQAIALLSKQNEVLKLEQEVATASAQNTRLVILLLGIVLAAIGYWAYKIKRMQVAFRRLAQIDGLTGLCNRRHFHAEAEALLGRCAASGKDAALVLLDLDHFKHINDRHGHATGDRVLKQVAEACQAACRDGDLCGRLGGEEFGILSSGGDIEAARRIAEACRQRLAAIDVASFGHDQPVTASFGCTTASCSGYDFEAMFSEADAAMYRAKHGGRDRIEVRAAAADPSVHEPRIAASHG